MEEIKGKRGRAVGQVKKVTKIIDNIIKPYEIHLDHFGYSLVNESKSNSLIGSYNALDTALKKTIEMVLADKEATFTLKGFIDEYKNLKETLITNF